MPITKPAIKKKVFTNCANSLFDLGPNTSDSSCIERLRNISRPIMVMK